MYADTGVSRSAAMSNGDSMTRPLVLFNSIGPQTKNPSPVLAKMGLHGAREDESLVRAHDPLRNGESPPAAVAGRMSGPSAHGRAVCAGGALRAKPAGKAPVVERARACAAGR